LKEAIKYTEKKTKEYGSLEKAKNKIEEIGVLINEKKRESEQLTRVIEIQKAIKQIPFVKIWFFFDFFFFFDFLFQKNLIDPSRKYLREGECIEEKNNLAFFLFNNLLLFANKAINKNNKTRYSYHKHFALSKEMTLEKLSPKQMKLEFQDGVVIIFLVVCILTIFYHFVFNFYFSNWNIFLKFFFFFCKTERYFWLFLMKTNFQNLVQHLVKLKKT
jgi:hypothetical protein